MIQRFFAKRYLTCIAGLVGLAAPLCVASPASAQEWLKDRRYQEGIGIRAGDLELHPGLAGEIGYDSNYLLRTNKSGANIANGDPNAPVLDGGMLRITPSLSLGTISQQRKEGDTGADVEPPKIAFRGGLSATYREFIGKEDLRKQRNVSGDANLRLDILPGAPLGFGIFGLYNRTIQANTANADPDLSFNRDTLGGGAEVITTPGRGTLNWRWGYDFSAALFEQTNGVGFDNTTHHFYTKGNWRFRPKTAVVYDGDIRLFNYTALERANNLLHDSTPTRSRIGLTGLVTPRFGFLGMVGWGASFFRPGSSPQVQQYNSVIGQAEAKFFLTANPNAQEENAAVSLSISSLAVGYTRDFANSYLADFYGSDRGYAKLSYFFAGRALVSLEGGVGAIEYPTIFAKGAAAPANPAFTDVRADGTLFGEYRFTNTIGVNTTLRYTANFSSTQLPIAAAPGTGGAAGTPGQVYDMNWRRFEAFLGARWFM